MTISVEDTQAAEEAARCAVTTAAGRSPAATRTPAQPPASPAGPRQWTLADIDKASRAELEEAMNAGLLVDLGVGVPKRRPWQRR